MFLTLMCVVSGYFIRRRNLQKMEEQLEKAKADDRKEKQELQAGHGDEALHNQAKASTLIPAGAATPSSSKANGASETVSDIAVGAAKTKLQETAASTSKSAEAAAPNKPKPQTFGGMRKGFLL